MWGLKVRVWDIFLSSKILLKACLSILIPACSTDRFPQSKVCFADSGDLKKSNKRKQAPNDAALLPAHCAVWSCWALWAIRKGSTLALFCLLSAPRQHWAVGDGAIVSPCHPWESWRFNLPSSMKRSSVLFCRQLDFPFPLSACLSASVYRHCVSKTRRRIILRVWAS